MIRLVLWCLPALVFYTERWPLAYTKNGKAMSRGGAAILMFVFIKPKYRGDEGLHRHELEHVRQLYASLWLHGILYRRSRKYRLWSEARAYREQMRYPDAKGMCMTMRSAAAKLAGEKYALGLTQDQAMAYLEEV